MLLNNPCMNKGTQASKCYAYTETNLHHFICIYVFQIIKLPGIILAQQ